MTNVSFSSSSYSVSPIAGENRDCAVRALSVAASISYEHAHRLLKAAGRMDKGSTPHHTITIAINTSFPEATLGKSPKRGVPLSQMLLFGYFAKGRYLVVTGRHALAVVDGVVHDWRYRSKLRVYYFFKFN